MRLIFYGVLLCLAAFLFVLPVSFAQDEPTDNPIATQEPTAEATQESGDTDAGETGDDESPWSQIPWGIIGIFVTGAAGLWKLPEIIDAVKRDPKAIAEAEERVNALGDSVRAGLHRVAEVVESAAGVLKEASDGIAASNKPPEALDLRIVEQALLEAELNRRGYTVTRLISDR